MKKDKILRNKTYLDELFSQTFPHARIGGETKQDEQPTLNEIWDWLGNPHEY